MADYADYTWELGIDWDALPTEGFRYLRHGFVRNKTAEQPAALVPLYILKGQTLDFRVFDVSLIPVSNEANRIKSFSLVIKAMDFFETQKGDPFDHLQLAFDPTATPQESKAFAAGSQTNFPAWSMLSPLMGGERLLTATTKGRFLVSFLLQAAGPDPDTNYIFAVDPEMIVGPNM